MKSVVLLLGILLSMGVSANDGDSLYGAWAVDIVATERSVATMAPRKDAIEIARTLLAIGPYLSTTMLVIEDDSATFAMYGDKSSGGKKFKLVSQNQGERKYVASNQASSTGDLTITVASNGYIRVSQGVDPLWSLLLWAPVSLQSTQTNDALSARISIWGTSLQKIQSHLFAQDLQQIEAIRPKRWSEDVILQDGRRLQVEREVSYVFKHSTGDAGGGFSISRNKLKNHRLQFKHPGTHKLVHWQGDEFFTPVLLDLIDGVPYLVLSAHPSKDTERLYGCTELPFIYLQYDAKAKGSWRSVSEQKAPLALKRANLSVGDEAGYKDSLSVADVQGTLVKAEESSRKFIQREIPRNYGEWRYPYKKGYRDDRHRDDCRPPRTPLPQMALPAPIEGSPEVLDTTDYTPDRIAIGDAWSELMFDSKRGQECKKLFRPADPDDGLQGQRFVNDPSGVKPVPYSTGIQFNMGVRVLCDESIWFVTHQEEPGKIVISNFTVAGDLVFRTSFPNPEKVKEFVGYIRIPSLRAEGGYLYFDWLHFRNEGQEWHIKRWLKMRVKEPVVSRP